MDIPFPTFCINIGSLAFSYVLANVLVPCTEFALNYLDDIMIFSTIWEDYLIHLQAVLK